MEGTPLTPRVTLRPVTRDDLSILFEHESDARSAAMAGVKSRHREAFLAHWRRSLASENVDERAILADGVLVGRIAVFEAPNEAHDEGRPVWMLGYWIGREYWGRGIASASVGLFLGEVIRRPLLARVLASNAASIRILEQAGFARTGQIDEPETDRYTAGLVYDYRLD